MEFGKAAFDIIMELISAYEFGQSIYDKLTQKSQFEKNCCAKRSITTQLEDKLRSFMINHEEDLFLDSDWFCNHLKYQNPVEKIVEYLVGDRGEHGRIIQDGFIDRLVCNAREAAQVNGRGFTARDQLVLKELYQVLADGARDILNGQMDLPQQYSQSEIIRNIWQAKESQIDRMETLFEMGKTEFSEKKYEYPAPHIKRYCYNQENRLTGESKFINKFQLTELCQKYPFIILLGEAGNGKSTELQWTAAFYSENSGLPRPVYLTLKTYIDETIENLAKKQGFSIEEEHELFFLIDGFDEISGGNKQNFLKQLTAYHEQNPKARFLVSARNNFYRKDLLGDYFETVWIEPLTDGDVAAFVRELGIDDRKFLFEIEQRNLKELLLIPFYLIELCGIYQEKEILPERSQLMKELMEHKFAEDSRKFRMTMDIDIAEQKARIFSQLQKIAAAMHGMDCHYLSEKDYQKFIPFLEDRELLRYSSIWKFQEEGWQFSHNNFGEYLAAEYLARCPFDEVKKLVSAGYPELGICRNWNHVLSYLLFMGNEDIEEWLLEADFTLFFDSDVTRIPAQKRSKILRKEWERLKKQHEWITGQRYRPEKLMQFGVNYLEIDMFLNEIRNPLDIVIQQNAILALSYCPNLFGCDDRVRDTLMELCQIQQEHGGVYERAILCMLKLGLIGEKELEKLMQIFRETEVSEVRYALYRCIRVLGKADKYICFLADGLKYGSWNEGRLGNESSELHYTLMCVEEPSAAMKVIKELADNKRYFHIYQIDKVVEHIFTGFTEKGVRFTDDKWSTLVEFYERVSSNGLHNLENMVLNYFADVGEKIKLFQYELKNVEKGSCSWMIIRQLLDHTVSKWVLEQYKNGELDQNQVSLCIDFMDSQDAVFNELTALYYEKTGIQIQARQKIDYDGLRRQGDGRYLKAIICKREYLSLIEELIGLYGKERLTRKDMEEGLIEWEQNRYDLEQVKFDYFRSDNTETLQEWRNSVEQEWEEYESRLVISWLYQYQGKKEDIPDEIKEAAKAYFDRNIETINFSQMIRWLTDEKSEILDGRGQRMLYFAWLFDFPMEKRKAEGIFTASYFLDEEQIRSLLERHFTKEELKKIVLCNMNHGGLKGDDLCLHLRYCEEFEICECADAIRKIAVDDTRSEWVRKRAIKYFYQVIGPQAVCQVILPNLDGRLFMDTASKIVEDRPEGLEDLLWNYAQRSDKDKAFCYRYLIQLQDNRGLKAYREALEKKRRTEKNYVEDELLKGIGNIRKEELWEELFKIVELWCQPDFEDIEYRGLHNVLGMALSGIAGSGGDGYERVKALLEKGIEEETITFSKRLQLEYWLGEAKESYRQSVQRKWGVDEAKNYIFGSRVDVAKSLFGIIPDEMTLEEAREERLGKI